jgi:hypothetical protein
MWDDAARGRALRLTEYETSLCSCGCGLPMADAHKEQPFAVETFTCHAGRAIQQARRKANADAKAAKKPDGWDDGIYYLARPHKPKEGK